MQSKSIAYKNDVIINKGTLLTIPCDSMSGFIFCKYCNKLRALKYIILYKIIMIKVKSENNMLNYLICNTNLFSCCFDNPN